MTEIGHGSEGHWDYSSYSGGEEDREDEQSKVAYALIWWTTWIEANAAAKAGLGSWPGYLRESLACRLNDRLPPLDLKAEEAGVQQSVAMVAERVGRRPLKVYCGWFDQDVADDLLHDTIRRINGVVPPHIKQGTIGVLVRKRHFDLLHKIGVVTNMDFEVIS